MKRYAAVIALAAAWLAVAVDVLYGGPISNLDGWIAERVLLPRRSPVTLAVLFWTNLHSLVAISLYATVFALLLARRRAWDWVVGVALAVPGGMLLNAVLKLAIQRSRPVLDNPVLALETYSFPSGHTAASTVFYGVLAAYLCSRFPRHRALLISAAAVLVASVSYSRMALGVHYFGDVLAALLSSGAWLVICLRSVHVWRAAHPR